MRVFCSQCGTSNEGEPGAKVMCVNCTAVFEVPGGSGDSGLQAVPPVSVQTDRPAPSVQDPLFSSPSPTWPQSSVYGHRVQGQPSLHPLAIVSMVLGIVCCIPFSSTAALVCGVIAIGKINQNPGLYSGKGLAIAGTVLGGLGLLFDLAWIAKLSFH